MREQRIVLDSVPTVSPIAKTNSHLCGMGSFPFLNFQEENEHAYH